MRKCGEQSGDTTVVWTMVSRTMAAPRVVRNSQIRDLFRRWRQRDLLMHDVLVGRGKESVVTLRF